MSMLTLMVRDESTVFDGKSGLDRGGIEDRWSQCLLILLRPWSVYIELNISLNRKSKEHTKLDLHPLVMSPADISSGTCRDEMCG